MTLAHTLSSGAQRLEDYPNVLGRCHKAAYAAQAAEMSKWCAWRASQVLATRSSTCDSPATAHSVAARPRRPHGGAASGCAVGSAAGSAAGSTAAPVPGPSAPARGGAAPRSGAAQAAAVSLSVFVWRPLCLLAYAGSLPSAARSVTLLGSLQTVPVRCLQSKQVKHASTFQLREHRCQQCREACNGRQSSIL